jgi:hypothetical protein
MFEGERLLIAHLEGTYLSMMNHYDGHEVANGTYKPRGYQHIIRPHLSKMKAKIRQFGLDFGTISCSSLYVVDIKSMSQPPHTIHLHAS